MKIQQFEIEVGKNYITVEGKKARVLSLSGSSFLVEHENGIKLFHRKNGEVHGLGRDHNLMGEYK
jgi:hypothetical protein